MMSLVSARDTLARVESYLVSVRHDLRLPGLSIAMVCRGEVVYEAGEVVDTIKKWSYQGHLLDQEALLLELGDVLWYLVLIGSIFDWTLEEVVAANVAKLRKRYPEGFEAARSVHRDARAMIVRGTVLGRSHRGGTPPMLPPLGTLRACMVLFLGMVGGGRVRRLP